MAGGEARRKQLVDQHMGLVHSLVGKARKQLPPNVEYDELLGLGTTGLLEAAERFDPKLGHAFSTFAYYRIRGAIQDGVAKMGWLSRTEYRRFRLQARGDAYLAELAERSAANRATRGAAASDATRAREAAAQSLSDALAGVAAIFVTSLEESAPEGVIHDVPDSETDLETKQASAAVRAALENLPDKERHFIEHHYFKDRSLKDAGEAVGLSRSWASRLHARAIELLRQQLARADLAPAQPPAKKARVRKG